MDRLDKKIFNLGYVETRTKAKQLILEGKIKVNEVYM